MRQEIHLKSENARLEYEYVKLRESSINFLKFEHNELDGLVYDFKINGLKIQEKVCTPHNQTYMYSLRKNGGIIQ